MPGVNVTTAVRTGPVGTGDIVAGQVFMVGETERGPLDEPTLLRSFSDYTTYYGNYESGSLYPHVKAFFDEGGSRCYVMRIIGASNATGTIDLLDADDAETLTATAKNAGAWAAYLDVNVVAADVSGFKIKVVLDDVVLLTTRDLTSVTDAINVINSSAVSHLVELSLHSSSTELVPKVADYTLAGGSDGSDVTPSEYSAAIHPDTTPISPNFKSGAICAPALLSSFSAENKSAVWDDLRDHAAANNRIAIIGLDSTTASAAKSAAADYAADPKASYMAFYWPQIKVAAPSAPELATGTNPVQGSTITITADAYAAGARARAIQEAGGPWRAGAGQISQASTVRALAYDVTPATGDALDEARVNAIRKIGNTFRVYGARSASNDEANWRYITQRDTLNYIVVGAEERMEQYVFSTIDGRGGLFGKIRGSLKAFLEPIRVAGGLFEAYDETGVLIDPGYNVVVDSTINPTTQLATGLVKAQVGVRVSGVADLIDIVITKSNLSAPVI
jgi:hypothetical protein